MAGMSSYGIALSGMTAAQVGLYVTGHNVSNVDTPGYSRQRAVQKDVLYNTIGYNAYGALKLGLGTDIANVRQIRDKFIDATYRREVGKLGFYDMKTMTGNEIEMIIGELQSEYNAQSVVTNLFNSLQELSSTPSDIAKRLSFISNCQTFLTKMNNAADRLLDYQNNLDKQVRDAVKNINSYTAQISELNDKIMIAEASGDYANDYRDERNELLDTLNYLVPIIYKEQPNGRVDITVDGKELLVNGFQNVLGLKYESGKYPFVEPVFTSSAEILPYDTPEDHFTRLFDFDRTISAKNDNDNGALLGLLLSRGHYPANYTDAIPPDGTDLSLYPLGINDPAYIDDYKHYKNATEFMIPKAQSQLDAIVHRIITLINDTLSPYDPAAVNPYDLNGDQSKTEIFTRRFVDRFDGGGNLIPENPHDYYSLYTIGNVEINPELLSRAGYNLLCLSPSGDIDDPNLLNGIIQDWNSASISIGGSLQLNINDAYSLFVTNIGIETNESANFVGAQVDVTQNWANKRNQIMSVSLDEELKNMMVYQHAYNASARMFNVIDSMVDRIVNATGRVGL